MLAVGIRYDTIRYAHLRDPRDGKRERAPRSVHVCALASLHSPLTNLSLLRTAPPSLALCLHDAAMRVRVQMVTGTLVATLLLTIVAYSRPYELSCPT